MNAKELMQLLPDALRLFKTDEEQSYSFDYLFNHDSNQTVVILDKSFKTHHQREISSASVQV